MLRNAFLGKFDRDDMKRIDHAIKVAKEGLEETTAALNERTRSAIFCQTYNMFINFMSNIIYVY